MLTIIYLDLATGYKSLDVPNSFALQQKIKALSQKGQFIVCVVNRHIKHLIQRCGCFESHRKFVEACFGLDSKEANIGYLKDSTA